MINDEIKTCTDSQWLPSTPHHVHRRPYIIIIMLVVIIVIMATLPCSPSWIIVMFIVLIIVIYCHDFTKPQRKWEWSCLLTFWLVRYFQLTIRTISAQAVLTSEHQLNQKSQKSQVTWFYANHFIAWHNYSLRYSDLTIKAGTGQGKYCGTFKHICLWFIHKSFFFQMKKLISCTHRIDYMWKKGFH